MLLFLVGAVAHAIAFVRWKTRSAEEKLKGWKHHGWFTALSCLCCVSGMLAYAARTGNTALIYTSSSIGKQLNQTASSQQERNEVLRGMLQFSAAHWALLPLEIGLLINANLLIIQRLRRFSSRTSSQNRIWSIIGRVLFVAINIANVVGFCGNIAVSVYFYRSSQLYDDAAKAWAGNNSTAGKDLERQAGAKTQEGVSIASVQRFCEVVALLATIMVFLFVGLSSARVVATAIRALFVVEQKLVASGAVSEREGASSAQGRQLQRIVVAATAQGKLLQRKLWGTFLFNFFTVLLRSIFTIMYALAQRSQDYGNTCAVSHCDPCKNVYATSPFFHCYIVFFVTFEQLFPHTFLDHQHSDVSVPCHFDFVSNDAASCALGHDGRAKYGVNADSASGAENCQPIRFRQ